MVRVNAWQPELTDAERRLLDAIPKSVLFVVARQLGALSAGCADDLDVGTNAIMAEWVALYRQGIVPQKPIWPTWRRSTRAIDAAGGG